MTTCTSPTVSRSGLSAADVTVDTSECAIALRQLQAADGTITFVVDLESRVLLQLDGPVEAVFGLDRDRVMSEPTIALQRFEPIDQASLGSILAELHTSGRVVKSVELTGPRCAVERPLCYTPHCQVDRRVRAFRLSLVLVLHNGRQLVAGSLVCLNSMQAAGPRDPFRIAVDHANVGLGVTDSNGRFVFLNQEHVRLFGYNHRDELIGQSWRALYSDEWVKKIEIEAGPTLRKQGLWKGAGIGQQRDGSPVRHEITLHLLPDGGIVSICRDRSAELLIADKLQNQEALFRRFVGQLPFGVSIRSVDGPYEFVSDICAEYLGVPTDKIIGYEAITMLPSAFLTQMRELDGEVVAKNAAITRETSLYLKGRHSLLEVTKFPLGFDARQISHICTLFRDVTEQNRLQREEKATWQRSKEFQAMQREFISMVSHEFRTPLTAIQGTHYLLTKKLAALETTQGSDLTRLLRLQQAALGTLKELVDQVLLLNRIEHMTTETVTVPAEIPALLLKVASSFNDAMEAPRVTVSEAGPAGWTALVNEPLVRAALENLVSNGLKYSPADRPVDVRLTIKDQEWLLQVEDQGRGIPVDEQGKLFQPFFRANNVAAIPGTGLGLTIVKRVADFHGGRIEFASVPGTGTTFSLVFPIKGKPMLLPS